MNVQELCTKLQNLAHEGYARYPVLLRQGDEIDGVALKSIPEEKIEIVVIHHSLQYESVKITVCATIQ